MREAIRGTPQRCCLPFRRGGTVRRGQSAVALLVGGVAMWSLVGCGSDSTSPVHASTSSYNALRFDWPAVTMALDNAHDSVVQLTAIPVTQTGAPILGAGPVHYTALDSNVTVSGTGLVTAHYPTSMTHVVASLTVDGVTHVDTANIMVTRDPVLPAPLDSFSIQPRPGYLDSAKISYDQSYNINQYNGNIPLYATDTRGDTVCDVYGDCPFLVAFGSSNPTVATLISPWGYLNALFVGKTIFTASAMVDGVGMRDSLPFTIGYNLRWFFQVTNGGTASHVVPQLSPTGFVLGVGALAGLATNHTNQAMEVSVPYNTPKVHRVCCTGSSQLTDTIPAGSSDHEIYVQFDSAGTYTFRVTLLGSGATTTGTVIVSSGP